MKKIWNGKKALSPVVAAIILIAVTVAVSIAVAAWMGALTFTFMGTEQLEIRGCVFDDGPDGDPTVTADNYVTLTVQNTGTADATISHWKDGPSGQSVALTTPVDVEQGASPTVDVPLRWSTGTTYDIYLVTSSGKQFPYRATAP